MQAVVKLSGLSALLRLAAVAVTIVAGAPLQPADAQAPQAEPPQAEPPQAEGPPVAIGGWRYERRVVPREKGASDVHLFDCEAAACVPGSRVSYRFYAAGTTMPLSQYRSEQELVVKALQQRAAPGTKITIVAIEGDDVDTLPRMYKSRRLVVSADGTQEHVHSGLLMGEKASVSLISSSRDEKAATVSFSLYALALMLVAQGAPGPKK
jgi:uncharacterized protein YndB with AHSA1/START domain